MNGIETYANKYDIKCRKRIAKCNDGWMLNGFYNSIIYKKSYATAYLYLSYVINFLKSIEDVTKITIDDYYSFLATQKNKSSSAQIDAYHALQHYSKYLKTRGVCDDYMSYIDRPKFIETQETKEKREKGYLTKSEIDKMFSTALNDLSWRKRADCWKIRDTAILAIFINTGIRCSAMYKLDVENVDFDNLTISVLEKGYVYRKIYISEQTADKIKDWLFYRNELMSENPNEKALIISRNRRRMETESIYATIKKLGKDITGKNITPHKLRATYGTCLYDKTGDVYFVQQCMGHSSPTVTEKYIRGKKNETLRKASEIMSDFME